MNKKIKYYKVSNDGGILYLYRVDKYVWCYDGVEKRWNRVKKKEVKGRDTYYRTFKDIGDNFRSFGSFIEVREITEEEMFLEML